MLYIGLLQIDYLRWAVGRVERWLERWMPAGLIRRSMRRTIAGLECGVLSGAVTKGCVNHD